MESNTINQTYEFTKLEKDAITLCWDMPELFGININPDTKAVTIINIIDNKVAVRLGYTNKTVEKFIRYCDLIPTYKKI